MSSSSTNPVTPEQGSDRPHRGAAPPPPPMSARGVLVGTVVLAALLLGFAWWANEAGLRAGAEARAVPDIVLVEPADGSLVEGSVDLVFETDAELRRGPAGWEVRGHHIHAAVDGVELMPGADDIARLGGNRYTWRVRPLNPGTRELRLFWSDRNHREIADGASRTVRVESR
jgi:hypothetical protein